MKQQMYSNNIKRVIRNTVITLLTAIDIHNKPISEEERHYIKCLKSIKDAKDTEFNAVLSNSAFSLDDMLRHLKSIEVVTLEELQEKGKLKELEIKEGKNSENLKIEEMESQLLRCILEVELQEVIAFIKQSQNSKKTEKNIPAQRFSIDNKAKDLDKKIKQFNKLIKNPLIRVEVGKIQYGAECFDNLRNLLTLFKICKTTLETVSLKGIISAIQNQDQTYFFELNKFLSAISEICKDQYETSESEDHSEAMTIQSEDERKFSDDKNEIPANKEESSDKPVKKIKPNGNYSDFVKLDHFENDKSIKRNFSTLDHFKDEIPVNKRKFSDDENEIPANKGKSSDKPVKKIKPNNSYADFVQKCKDIEPSEEKNSKQL